MPSGRFRSAGPAALLLGFLLIGSCLLGSCTSVDGAPTAARDSTAAVTSGSTASTNTAGAGDPTERASVPAAVGDSTMTPVPEASGCSSVINLGNRAPVRAEQLWPGASQIGSDAVDARARSGVVGCTGELPTSPDCDLSLPWAALDAEELLRMSGADRVVSGRAYASLAAFSGSNTGVNTGATSLLYVALDFGADRSRLAGATEWFAGAVERCRLGAPGSLAGVTGLVGERHKPTLGPGDAGVFLVTTQGSQLVCLVFEGAAWTATSRADVVRRVLPLLRAA